MKAALKQLPFPSLDQASTMWDEGGSAVAGLKPRFFELKLAVEAWFSNHMPELLKHLPEFPMGLGKADLVEGSLHFKRLPELLARASLSPDARAAFEIISEFYTQGLDVAHRAKFGVFFTPTPLVDHLVGRLDGLVAWETARIVDPSCGGGAFLLACAERMMKNLQSADPRIALRSVEERLLGLEIDPVSAWIAQCALQALLGDICLKLGRPLSQIVRNGDALEYAWQEGSFDLVIGNPPFGRAKLNVRQREKYARSLYGHANLYGIFTDLAVQISAETGLVAYVTPTSMLSGLYFSSLRTLLLECAPPVSVDFLTARKGVFADVLQETMLSIYQRKPNTRSVGACPRISNIQVRKAGAGQTTSTEVLGRFSLPCRGSEPWLLPRSLSQVPAVAAGQALSDRLKDWGYRVSTGPLVWNRHKAQLSSKKTKASVPVIWAEAVCQDGSFDPEPRKRANMAWLEAGPSDDWLIVRQPCILVQRTTAKEQRRRLVAASLNLEGSGYHGGVVVENHLNMIRCINEATEVVHADVVAAFLNSQAADLLFRCLSGSVAVSAFELENLPLPSKGRLSELERLVLRHACRSEIEDECAKLVGICLS